MQFRYRQLTASLPRIDLTPMLNVMMGILGFFVIVTMMMSEEQRLEVQLPSAPSATPSDVSQLLIVRLTPQGQLLINDQPISRAQLAPQIQSHLNRNAQGFVVLRADQQVPYQQVVNLLSEMKTVGGERVSLAVE